MSRFNLVEKLSIGQSLHITWMNRVYSSLLLDISNTHLDIGVIQAAGKQVWLAPDSVVTVGFGIPESGYYRFKTQIDKAIAEPGPSLRLAYPTQIERVQQRRHYRLPISIPISLRVINDLSSHRSFITCQGNLIDISGGGMQFVTQEKLNFFDLLEIDVPEASIQAGILGVVLRTNINSDGAYQTSVRFERLERDQEDAIIRFIFREQVRRRRLQM